MPSYHTAAREPVLAAPLCALAAQAPVALAAQAPVALAAQAPVALAAQAPVALAAQAPVAYACGRSVSDVPATWRWRKPAY
jgi:hypothetical protein